MLLGRTEREQGDPRNGNTQGDGLLRCECPTEKELNDGNEQDVDSQHDAPLACSLRHQLPGLALVGDEKRKAELKREVEVELFDAWAEHSRQENQRCDAISQGTDH